MKRKVGLIVGYSGEGYHGLQWNKDTVTIERAVMDILLDNGLVTELNAVDAQKIDMKSSSRTDKGVHASFNLIQAKICKEPTEEIEADLKKGLASKGVQLYKMIRLPKKFIAHKMARSRIYKYIVPTCFLKESSYTEEYLRRAEEDVVNENETNDDKCNRLNESNENNSVSSEEQVTEGKAKTFGYRKYSI
ncbi:tRNA pseudouridine38-40 synthase, partial [Pancytospora epiphaga]